MQVTLRFFAALREALGPGHAFELPEGSTVAQARDALIAQGEAPARVLARGKAVRAAVNQVLADEAQVLQAGDELAFFPPVTGG